MGELPGLTTERLLLRPFSLSDAKDVQRLAGDRSIADTTFNIPHPYEDGQAEQWISRHTEFFDKGTGNHFAITAKTDGLLIGAISLMNIRAGHQYERSAPTAVPNFFRNTPDRSRSAPPPPSALCPAPAACFCHRLSQIV
jgi:hypothetical protein